MMELKTANELAKILRITGYSVRKMAREGLIPSLRVGGIWRFNPDDVLVALTIPKAEG